MTTPNAIGSAGLPVPPLGSTFTIQSCLGYIIDMNACDLITIDREILGGTPVFKGTRVPVKTLFEYLENNYTVDEFVECFPSVSRELVLKALECSEAALLKPAA